MNINWCRSSASRFLDTLLAMTEKQIEWEQHRELISNNIKRLLIFSLQTCRLSQQNNVSSTIQKYAIADSVMMTNEYLSKFFSICRTVMHSEADVCLCLFLSQKTKLIVKYLQFVKLHWPTTSFKNIQKMSVKRTSVYNPKTIWRWKKHMFKKS